MTMQFDTIDISLHHQEGWRSPTGSESPERFTVDFVVNGESLYSLLDVARYGHASRFAADFRDRNQEAVDVFLMKKLPDIEGRAILYECSLCADSGCGVFLVKITRSDQGYVWSEFGFDQGWGDDQFPQLDLERYKGIGRSVSRLNTKSRLSKEQPNKPCMATPTSPSVFHVSA
jgi:hypothetical protein